MELPRHKSRREVARAAKEEAKPKSLEELQKEVARANLEAKLEDYAKSENAAVLMDREQVSADMLEQKGFLVPNEAWGATSGSDFMVTPDKLAKMDAYPGVDFLGMGCGHVPASLEPRRDPLVPLPLR